MSIKEATDRRAREAKMWEKWKQDRNPANLEPLLSSFKPLIRSAVRKWSGSGIPDPVLTAKAEVFAVKAFGSFDPKKKASLGTHVFNNVQRLSRVVTTNQNVARIPEHRVAKIGTYQNIRSHLEGELDREPTSAEMADKLSWSLKDVNRMEAALRQDLLASDDVLGDYHKTGWQQDERNRDLVDFIYYELAPREKTVFEYLTGKYGKTKKTASQIAKIMGVSNATVSRIRKNIERKIEGHLG
jgi:RNA polymerase sigma factor (sigma-70 family)